MGTVVVVTAVGYHDSCYDHVMPSPPWSAAPEAPPADGNAAREGRDPRPPSSAASPLSLGDFDGVVDDVSEEVVAAFDSLLHAELVRGRLEASGIGCRLRDAHTVGLASHLAQAVGGVKVVVSKDDADDARALLASPVLVIDGALPDDGLPTQREPHVDDVARWALRLSLLGILLPIIGQIGSLAFVVQAIAGRKGLSRRGRAQLSVAIVVDVGVTIALAASLS